MADESKFATDQLGVAGTSEAVSKFAIKLLELVQVGIGGLLAPWHLQRMARARAEAIKYERLAKAEVDAKVLETHTIAKIAVDKLQLQGAHELEEYRKELEPGERSERSSDEDEIVVVWEDADGNELDRSVMSPLPERTRARLEFQEAKRQTNIEQVVSHAFNEGSSDEAVSDETVSEQPVDPDWVARFFENVKDVSDADMQKLWGKLLAGEIVQPGKYPIRMLDVVRNMSSSEAKLFDRYCGYITVRGELAVPASDEFEVAGIADEEELALLVECGLFHPPSELLLTVGDLEKPKHQLFWEKLLKISVPDGWEETKQELTRSLMPLPGSSKKVPPWAGGSRSRALMGPMFAGEVYRLTSVGRHLFELGLHSADDAYIEALSAAVCEAGFEVEVTSLTIQEMIELARTFGQSNAEAAKPS